MSCKDVFRMFEGYYGPYFTPAVDEDGNLTWTNNAGLPNPPAINIKGEPGTGLEISGLVATEADLPATAEDWTCYLVGTEVPYTVYTYNPTTGWMSLGELASGPKGDPGAVYTPSVSAAGLLSWTNDGGLPNPEPVNIKGQKGNTGEGVPAGGTPGQVLTKTEDGTAWEDPQGGGGTGNYNDLSNQPQIGGVTLQGNKTPAQLGLATPGDIPTVPVQSVNGKTGAVVLNASDVGAGTYSLPSGGIPASDLASAVQTSLGKADTALQSVPSTYRTAAAQDTIDSGKIDKPSNPSSGAFLVWNGSAWVAQTLAVWQGGSY